MKSLNEMTQPEIGAYVVSHLKKAGISVVLSGGAVVSIYSQARYVSKDLDLVNIYSLRPSVIKKAMEEIGFEVIGRHFKHPNSKFIIEFPPGPLSVGEEAIKDIVEKNYDTGVLSLISPTECVKDRLAAYYHWNDNQALEQSLLVATHQEINLEEIKRWSKREGMVGKFELFISRLAKI
jgi:hypothetical protein